MAKSLNQLFGKNRTELVGAAEVRALFKRLGNDARRRIMVPAMEKAMQPMLARAKTEVAVESGNLKGALVEKTRGATKGRILVDVSISRVYYAGFREYGTKKMAADHALLRTFDATKDQAIAIVSNGIAEGIEREGRK